MPVREVTARELALALQAPEAERPVVFGVTRKAPAKNQKDDELAGLDAPYELTVTVEPTR